MALKKPGDFFQRKEVVKLKEEIDQLVNPELSELSSAFDNYKEKVNKFELLSGVKTTTAGGGTLLFSISSK